MIYNHPIEKKIPLINIPLIFLANLGDCIYHLPSTTFNGNNRNNHGYIIQVLEGQWDWMDPSTFDELAQITKITRVSNWNSIKKLGNKKMGS